MEPTTTPAQVRTFLIADVRGYTQFTVERGDAEAARLAQKFAVVARAVVTAREGEVIELRGDEALAVFSSARQALWAALDLQTRCVKESLNDPSLPLRVGIGLDAGEAVPVEGGYRGAALNLTARLCALAGPGEVLSSETVVSIARKLDGVTYRERGLVQLKGFADPVRVMEVDTESLPGRDDRSRDDGKDDAAVQMQELPIGGFLGSLPGNPMVGRHQELEHILTAVDAVAQGAGRLVMLAGEPGAGKTRLAQEVTLHLRNRGFRIAAGSCFESRQTVPYYPFLDVLVALYGAAPSSVRSQVGVRWPYLGRLLPEAGIPTPPGVSEGQEERERLFRAITGFVRALAETAPVALLVDDLHWADDASLDVLQHLARHARASRVLLLASYRDVEVQRQHPLEGVLRDMHRANLMERVAVHRLGQAETGALVAGAFGEEAISTEFTQLVYQHTEGNPFFTQEVLRTLVERGDIYRQNGHWERREINEIEVPESVRSVIGERLSRLGENTQELLHEASVLGQTFDFDALRIIGGREDREVETMLDEAMAAGIVREVERDTYGFNHALTQQALYAELSGRRKRRLHLAAGESLENLPERKRQGRIAELAWHFLEGDDPQRALTYAILAGDQAEAVFARSDAERHFRRALELAQEIDNTPQVAKASFKLGSALRLRAEYDEAFPLLEHAANLYADLDDPVMTGRAMQGMAFIYSMTRRSTNATDVTDRLERLLDRIAECEPSRDLALFYHTHCRLLLVRGRLRESLMMAEYGIEVARALGDTVLVTRLELRRAEVLGSLGRVRDGITAAESVIPQAETEGDVETLGDALGAAAEFSMLAGEFERSRMYREREYRAHEQQDNAFEHAFALGNLAQIDLYLGEWRAARDFAERSLARGEAMDNGFVTRSARSNLGHIDLVEGNWEAAAGLMEEAAANPSGTLQTFRYIQRDLAELDVLRGSPEAGVARLEPIVEGADTDDNDITFLLPILAWAQLEVGDVPRSAEIAASAVERATAQENSLALVDALRVQGMVSARQGRWEEATHFFEQDVALARRMPYPYAESRALYEWGLMDVHRNLDQARDRLQQALAIFRRLGARKDIERTEETLAALSAS